jgi:beta-N-acetylhexosaminidase
MIRPRLRALIVATAVLALAACGTEVTPPRSARSAAPSPDRPAPSGGSSGPPTGSVAAARASRVAASLSDIDLVGQVLVPELYGESATSVTKAAAADNMALAGAPTPAQIIAKYRLGGVILANRASGDPTAATNRTTNIATVAQLRALDDGLQAAAQALPAGAPLLIGTDQEYGAVNRVRSGIVQLPSAMALGAAHDPALTRSAWATAGHDLAAVGINVDFAPDADVIAGSGNTVIGSRSFGDDAGAVSAQVAAAVTGLRSAGVATTIKHFPGHGDTDVDSHTALPVLSQSLARLTSVDLAPFRAGIAAGTDLVMAGHLDVTSVDPGIPSSFSHKVITDLLRGQLGFHGVVITDALNMEPVTSRWSAGEAAVRAILAGDDMLLMPNNLGGAQRGLLAALASGRIPRATLVASVARILTLKFQMPATPAAAGLDSATAQATVARAASAAITVLAGACRGPLAAGPVTIASPSGYAAARATLAGALEADGVRVVGAEGTLIDIVGYGDGRSDIAGGAAITVAIDTPYVLRYATSKVRIATYSSSRAAMTALAAVIAGRARPPGVSPVAVAGLPRTACPSSP